MPAAIDTITNAVTIDCPPRYVWPWVVQMGAGTRAGWYSYDRLDNGIAFGEDEVAALVRLQPRDFSNARAARESRGGRMGGVAAAHRRALTRAQSS